MTAPQLWTFTSSSGIVNDDIAPEVHWVAAESLDSALRYMQHRFDDFMITEARFPGMIPLTPRLIPGLMATLQINPRGSARVASQR